MSVMEIGHEHIHRHKNCQAFTVLPLTPHLRFTPPELGGRRRAYGGGIQLCLTVLFQNPLRRSEPDCPKPSLFVAEYELLVTHLSVKVNFLVFLVLNSFLISWPPHVLFDLSVTAYAIRNMTCRQSAVAVQSVYTS